MRIPGVSEDLTRAPDLVAASGSGLGQPMVLLAETSSTNDLATRAARDGAPHGATWVAEQQTQGRGRRGHTWVSAAGENLLFSVLVRIPCAPARIPPIALVAGLAVRDAVAAATGAAIAIKWPNDVLAGSRKVAGVLVEAVTMGSRVEAIVIGIGINVHARSFPGEIAAIATSVSLVATPSSPPPDRACILASVLSSLDRDVHVVVGRGLGLLHARLEQSDALRGHRVRGDTGDEGVASGIDEDGRLLVRRDDGVLARWSSGEVHLVR
jgi:BirA family transcriptional regulator, biotin operon repressor / biotin---[acetyl-CoA-carboxylase] ligase